MRVEHLERRELLATLTSGVGDGHLTVSVNEYGAFGRSGTLAANEDLPNVRDVNDAFYDPPGPIGSAGTVFESGLAIKVGNDPVTFLTAGTIANSGNFTNGQFTSRSNTQLQSTFYYPANANPNTAILRFDLVQRLVPKIVSGTTPVGVTLEQQYTITNLTGSAIDIEVYRYLDGDMLFDTLFGNDGAGMRQVFENEPERVWMTNQATNTNRNDLTYLEVRSDQQGVPEPRVDRWEVGLAFGAIGTGTTQCTPNNPCKNQPFFTTNGPLVDKILNHLPLNNDIVRVPQADIDNNNKVDNGAGDDWAVALRNVYTLQGSASEVYETQTQWGDPEIGDPDPPVIPPPQIGAVRGVKFSDRDGDGVQDPDEPGVAGFRIYSDLNNNGVFDTGEPSTVTDATGAYNLELNLGTHTIREVQQPNWTQTAPAAGFYTVTLVNIGDIVTDQNFGNQAAPGSVSGIVFDDANRNGVFDAGELGLGGALIFADLNNDGTFQPTEPNVTSTAGTGAWNLSNLDPATYVIRQVPPGGYTQSFPANGAPQTVSLQAGQNLTGINFGDRLLDGQINGKVFVDVNGNGVIDPGEPGAGNVIVYVDRDNDCKIGLGENGIVTGPSGTFGLLGIPPGTYTVRLALPAGYDQVLPAPDGSGCNPGLTVTVAPGQPTNLEFLVANTGGSGPDFGDAPAPYPTTLAQNGARATIQANFGLGVLRDGEANGQPSIDARGDDDNLLDDEDGVEMPQFVAAGQVVVLPVTIRTGGSFPGKLQGWIDFNRDGDWNDPGERIFLDLTLPEGTHNLSFVVPASAVPGLTYARFRYGYESGLGPTGPSLVGEVEDYALTIVGANPIAQDDTFPPTGDFTIDPSQPAPTFTLDVLANDSPTLNGIVIVDINAPPELASRLQVVFDAGLGREVILYTPDLSTPVTQETFSYTIADALDPSQTDTATVEVNLSYLAAALDDTAFAQINQTILIPVLNNDLQAGAQIVLQNPLPAGVTATVVTVNGVQMIQYTAPGTEGTQQFQYQLQTSSGLSNAATVTVHVDDPNVVDMNNLVEHRLRLFEPDFSGELLSNVLAPGEEFYVLFEVRDPRTSPVIEPPSPDDLRGVFSAYVDLLYDPTRLEVVPDPNDPFNFDFVTFNFYTTAITADANTPGLINEAGASQSQNADPAGTGFVSVFAVRLRVRADAPEGDALIVTDPTEDPASDTTTFHPPAEVPIDQIAFAQTNIVVDATPPGPPPGGEAEPIVVDLSNGPRGSGLYSNPIDQFDVDNDGLTSPLDALLIINSLNLTGPRSMVGEPRPASMSTKVYLDVDGDDLLTPLDALLVINKLNASVAAAQSEPAPEIDTDAGATHVSLGAGESVTLPLIEQDAPASSLVAESSQDETVLEISSASSATLQDASAHVLAADFALSGYSSHGADDEMDDLLAELAQETCLRWAE